MPNEKNVKTVKLFNDNLNFTQGLFDAVHPIGEIYIQFPQQDDPMTLYNKNGIYSIWQEQAQYNGAFFRSSNAPNAIYRADYEIDCYIQDSQTGNLIPINVTALGGPTISPTPSGESIYVEGKEYKRYVVTAGSRNAANFITETDNLTIQADQFKSHRHTINHGHSASSTAPTVLGFGQGAGSGDCLAPGSASRGWLSGYSQAPTITVNAHNGNSGYTGDSETRPLNFTHIIWKRIL